MIDWFTTKEERRISLAQAKYDKINKLEWLNRNNPLKVGEVRTDLTLSEAKEVLRSHNATKSLSVMLAGFRDDNRARAKAKRDELVRLWDYGYFFRVMKDRAQMQGKELILNDTTMPIIKAMCFRLSGDKRYETELGLSFQKMLIIRGAPGLGKSWIPSLVADNPIQSMQILTINEITETVRTTGEFKGFKFGTFDLVYLDDIGTEETPVKYYGTELHWFKTWFENFYATSKHCFWRVLMSTNENFDTIGVKYGFRVRDRMREVCDVLDLTGESMRK